MTPTKHPDPFLLAIAELAGLDPDKILADSLTVSFERVDVVQRPDPETFEDAGRDPGGRKTVAHVQATAYVEVDPDEVIRLALEHDRIGRVR